MRPTALSTGIAALLVIVGPGRLVPAAPMPRCAIDAPEASQPVFAATGLAQHTTHFYDVGVPIDLVPESRLLLQTNPGAMYVRDPDLGEMRLVIPLTGRVVTATAERFADQTATGIVVTQEDGYVIRWDYASGEVRYNWSRDLGRSACGDSAGDLAVQPGDFSTEAFRATYGSLLYVGTRYDAGRCGGYNTDNRVLALDPHTGQIVWIFNEYGAIDVDTISGLAIDRVLVDEPRSPVGVNTLQSDQFHDRLFVATERTFGVAQHSVWAINTMTGTHVWSASAGRIHAKPVVRDDRLYVATVSGEVKALDKTNGVVVWSIHQGIPFVKDFTVGRRAPYDDLIVLTDYFGRGSRTRQRVRRSVVVGDLAGRHGH